MEASRFTRLVIATRSAGKAREIRALFAGHPFDVVFPSDLGLERRPDEGELETSERYLGNAVAKARYFARRGGLPAVADDSGLEVDALGGAPGVVSARWAKGGDEGWGMGGADVAAANNALLLERLVGVPPERRTARYRCVVAFLAGPDAPPVIMEGTCEGRILDAPRGSGGFGYDPLFWSVDLGMSFGEAPAVAKDRVSHRGRAFRALIGALRRGAA